MIDGSSTTKRSTALRTAIKHPLNPSELLTKRKTSLEELFNPISSTEHTFKALASCGSPEAIFFY